MDGVSVGPIESCRTLDETHTDSRLRRHSSTRTSTASRPGRQKLHRIHFLCIPQLYSAHCSGYQVSHSFLTFEQLPGPAVRHHGFPGSHEHARKDSHRHIPENELIADIYSCRALLRPRMNSGHRSLPLRRHRCACFLLARRFLPPRNELSNIQRGFHRMRANNTLPRSTRHRHFLIVSPPLIWHL